MEFATTSVAETQALAARLARAVDVGDCLVLNGDLGAGKTAFVQGLARELGVAEPVTSPTFNLLVSYDSGHPVLHHLDVYRLSGPDDAMDLDLHELAETGVTVIEWGDRLAELLPDERLDIEISLGTGPDDRVITLRPHGRRWQDWVL